MLRADRQTIVNLIDLQKYASLSQLYNQLEQFCEFAEVHCVPMVLLFDDGQTAEYLDKQFWLDLLREKELLEAKTGTENMDAGQCAEVVFDLRVLLYERKMQRRQFIESGIGEPINWSISWNDNVELAVQRFRESYGNNPKIEAGAASIRKDLEKPYKIDDAIKKQISQELEQGHIKEKLTVILNNNRKNGDNSPVSAISMLAISMLTECSPAAEPQNQQPAFVKKEPPKDSKPSKPVNLSPMKTPPKEKGKKEFLNQKDHTVKEAEKSAPVPSVELINANASYEKLECRDTPYRWWLYEVNEVPKNEVIHTVKIEAVKKQNGFGNVCIQLYSEKRQMVWELSLKPGEYRYCNMIQGKIVCFLPTVAVCDEFCVYRPNYYSSDIRVWARKDKRETQLAYGSEVSSYSVCKDGEMYLRKGRVMSGRYLPCKNNQRIADKLEALSYETFVEVHVNDKGYMLLNNKGLVRSNIPEWDGKRAASLYGNDWMQNIPVNDR